MSRVLKSINDKAAEKIIQKYDSSKGDYLIDDRTKNGAGEFDGELILFGSEKFPNWQSVCAYLM